MAEKKLVTANFLVSVNGSDFKRINFYSIHDYTDGLTELDLVAPTFEQAIQMVKDFNGHLPNVTIKKRWFNKRDAIEVKFPYIEGPSYTITESNFKEFAVKYVYEDWEPTMDELCKCLSADKVCEYLKDKGVGFTVTL